MTGRILLAQEGRFDLLLDAGRAEVFLLAPGSGVEPADLADLQRRQVRVSVEAVEASGLIARLAQSVTELGEKAA